MEDEVVVVVAVGAVGGASLKGEAPLESGAEGSVVLSDDGAEEVIQGEEGEVVSGGYRSGRVRTKGEILAVDRAPAKRKQHVDECGPVVSDESESDEYASSSSDSDASDGEYEHWSRTATSGKRRRRGEEHIFCGSVLGTEHESVHHHELKEMQQLLELQLQASERREAGMKQRMEAMMEMLAQHMGHVEKRACTLEFGAQPHDQVLERINLKLDKVMEGFATLNENLSLLSACLSGDVGSR